MFFKRILLAGLCCSLFIVNCSLAEELGDLALKHGVGVRALGMGGAYTAIANDASAVFYNPAALAEMGIGYTYGNLDTEEKNNAFTYTLVKLGFLGYVEGKATNSANNDELSFNALGFGNRSGWLNWGANFKKQEWTLSGVKNNGWTSDVGLLLRITPKLKVGIVAQDVMMSKSRIVPASLRIGLGLKPFDGQLLLAADAEMYRSQPNYGHLGIELNLVKGFSLRGGIDRGSPTLGASLDMAVFSIDYAVLLPADGRNVQRVEAGVKFSPERERPFSLIKPREFVLIDIRGALKGGLNEYSLLGGMQAGLDSILEKIRLVEKDRSVDGIILRIGGFEGGLGGAAAVQELRAELARVKAGGKKIIAYIEGSALGDEYYLASVADRIVAAPGSGIGGFGKSLAVYRLWGLYKKIGIEWQVFSKGKFKYAVDPLSPAMTGEQRKMLAGVVSDIYRQMLTDIAGDRRLTIDKAKEIGDGMFFPARLAQKMGLIDKVGYFSDLCSLEGEFKVIEPDLVEPEETVFAQVFGVAVIEANGELVSGSGGQNLIFGGSYVGSDKIIRDIRKAGDDVLVKAVLLRIDSPGGSSIAAGEIYEALQYARARGKVIIASIGSIGASGGYYIATAADKIVVDRSSITGSIGVLGYIPTFIELTKKLGVTAEVIKEGAHADMFSGLRKLTTVETMAMERLQEEAYREFIDAVARGRKMTTAEVEKIAEGRLYTGSQALDLKLADQIGGFSDAVELAKKEAKIMGEPRLIYYREPGFWLQMGQGFTSALGRYK